MTKKATKSNQITTSGQKRKTSTRAKKEISSRLDLTPSQFREMLRWGNKSQSQFAKEMKVSPSTVSRYINGIAIPMTWIKKLIEIMGDEAYDYALNKVKEGKYFHKPLHHGLQNG